MILDINIARFYKAILGKTSSKTYQVPKIDPITHAFVMVDHPHHKIHQAKTFSAYYTITTAATAGHRSGLYVKTPPKGNSRLHMTISFAASTAAIFQVCRAPTIAAGTGTHLNVPYNHEEDSNNESHIWDNSAIPVRGRYTTLSEAEIAGDGTWATGTVIESAPLAAGDGPKPSGGVGRNVNEWIRKSDTAYVFLITNLTAAANTHYIYCDWYEHVPEKP